ncbi:hypothetical protein [Amedibacillus sp. YH-ame10]
MAIYDILCGIKDIRESETGKCEFNGYLEDYLSVLEADDEKKDIHDELAALLELSDDLKICVNLGLDINKDAIANQIIRYKDSFKLPSGTIRCPYVIYGSFETYQKAIILTLGDKEEYVIAKALYYVMSEPENEFEGTRNEIIAFAMNETNQQRMVEAAEAFFIQNKKAGIVQRDLDAKIFENYDEMYTLANKISTDLTSQLPSKLVECEEKENCINHIIATWFLMKKFSYVQYMMDKNNLNKVHEGNVKKQRQAAKEKCDAISFVSFSELWRMVKEI